MPDCVFEQETISGVVEESSAEMNSYEEESEDPGLELRMDLKPSNSVQPLATASQYTADQNSSTLSKKLSTLDVSFHPSSDVKKMGSHVSATESTSVKTELSASFGDPYQTAIDSYKSQAQTQFRHE